MATITQRNGRFRAQVRKGGNPISKTFGSRKDAERWAAMQELHADERVEAQAVSDAGGKYLPSCFREILEKYRDKVTVNKKTADREGLMIRKILEADWVDKPLYEVSVEMLTDYRDSRLQRVSAATISRHFDVIRHAALTAQDVWDWVSIVDKLSKVRTIVRQSKVVRRIAESDLDAIHRAAYESKAHHIQAAIALSLETGMRRSELAKLDWCDVNLDEGYLVVVDPKNGHDREIVLSPVAKVVLTAMEPPSGAEGGSVLGTTDKAITEAWKRIKRKAGVDVRFHDLRHESISRFFEKGFTPIEVASMSGHRTMSQLMRYSHAARDKMLARMNEVMS